MAENPQAFPISELGTHGTYGMTLRDFFAAKAMQAFIAANPEAWRGNIAVDAYAQADAMLAEREATP